MDHLKTIITTKGPLSPQDTVEGRKAEIRVGDRDVQMGGAQATLFPQGHSRGGHRINYQFTLKMLL